MKVVGKARLPAADLSRHVQVELPGPRAEALLFVHRARFRDSLRSDADRCEELRISYSMRRGLRDVHSFAPLHSQQFRTCSSKMRADIFAHIYESVSNITKYVS